jgi:hypothetical protein
MQQCARVDSNEFLMGVRWDEWLIRSEGTGLTLMIAHAKFCTGILLHNRNTKEDGLVTKVYHSAELGETMYQVAVSIRPDTWAGRHLVSDWAESTLARAFRQRDAEGFGQTYRATP